MVRFDCPDCEREETAVLRSDSHHCVDCGYDVRAGDVVTPDEMLTQRDWDALGKQGDPPWAEETESEESSDSEEEG